MITTRVRQALCALATASYCLAAAPVQAELVLPDWHSIFTQRAAPDSKVMLIRDLVSDGRAVDVTAMPIQTVSVQSNDGSIRNVRRANTNALEAGIVPTGRDIGNSYVVVSDEDGPQFYAATELVTRSSGVKSFIEFMVTQGQNWVDDGEVRRQIYNGDLLVRVHYFKGIARHLQVFQHGGDGWQRALRARFRPNGCAGHASTAIACISDLTDGGAISTNRGGRTPQGTRVSLPTADKLIEIGLDLSKFVSPFRPEPMEPKSVVVRTTRDISFGTFR